MASDFAVFLAIIVSAISLAVLAATSVVALRIYISRDNRGK
jgi:hypothetical protein